MSKVSGSYASITRGVSEQVPAERLPGQSAEMVNMVDDPVRGKSRRHGSRTLHEQPVAGLGVLTDAQYKTARQYREYSFTASGTDYSLVYMAGERASADSLPFCFVLNKDTGRFLNVQMSDPAALAPWTHGGVCAVTAAGRFVLLASSSLGPGYAVSDALAAKATDAVAEVKHGAYSRTYTLKVERADTGAVVTARYTTMASSYPELLDTSDIELEGNNNYQKEVNDRMHAYNSAMNKWIGDAAASVTPQHIAQQLVDALIDQGFTTAARVGGTVVLTGAAAVSASDGGDGTAFGAVAREVDDAAKLSAVHKPGKVVRVTPRGAAEPYYMVAHADTGGSSDFQTVVWKEGAAQVITPGQVFALGAVSADGQTFYLAHSPAALAALLGEIVPQYAPSVCGDVHAIGAVPGFFGRRITHLTVFMDRLVIAAGGVLFMSRTGDYFNWFRASKLTLKDDDPIEMVALGAEDDVLVHSVVYTKDLFLFGQSHQYTVSGRNALTPATASITPAARAQDATGAAPVTLGNLLFYATRTGAADQPGPSPWAGRIHQFQLGLVEDAPETYCISQQLARYLRGAPVELVALSVPGALVVRTDGVDNGLYVYRFIDQPGTQSRAWDSWSRWQWDTAVGRVIGITGHEASLYVFTLRSAATRTWVACEQFQLDGGLSSTPYLDMQRPALQLAAGAGFWHSPATVPQGAVALPACLPRAWLGGSAAQFATLWAQWDAQEAAGAVAGVPYPSRVVLTPPFVRDHNDKAITGGRLTVSRYALDVSDTGALDAYVHAAGAVRQVVSFNGRKVGQSNNQVGIQPITTTTLSAPVGRSTTEHALEVCARSWLPLTLTGVQWAGQQFFNSRRV